jgi:AAA+ ATPase superfamily predicted ATPase
VLFVNRERKLADLDQFWRSGRAECIPVAGRRRVGKTVLLERFSLQKRVVYYRCQLAGTSEQLPQLGAALAEVADDPVLRAQPPTTWPAIFALVERLTRGGRTLLVLDEIPYWVARDETLPSVLQNWWDARGRTLDLMLVLSGSAVQMMERLLTGEAPMAGCVTGRIAVRPFGFRAAAELLGFRSAVDALTAYGILGGVPLYLTFFRASRSIRDNVLQAVASPSARLYVEPQAVFAAHHAAFDARQALGVLRTIARGKHRWSEIADATGMSPTQLGRVMEPLIGDLGLVERQLPVTEQRESRTYFIQYHLTDNFFRFWFRFIEPNTGHIEFGDAERVVDGILTQLPDYMGLSFEAVCREWVRQASAAGALPVRVGRVGTWWTADHQVDVVGLDDSGRTAIAGECKWQQRRFGWAELERYLGHVGAMPDVRPDVVHVLCSKSGFDANVTRWAAETRALLLTPAALLSPFSTVVGRSAARRARGAPPHRPV